MKKNYILIATSVAAFTVMVGALGTNLRKIPGMSHVDPAVIQGILIVLGILAGVVTAWMMSRGQKKSGGEGGGAGAEVAEEVTDLDELLAEAEARLAVAQQEKDSKLGKVPAVIVLGDTGSVKTTTMVQSGLEVESLSGQVYEENNILPTPTANFWVAQHTVFVEMAGKLLGDSDAWKTLIKRLQPNKAAALIGTAEQVPRAAVVCVDAEQLMSPSPDALNALARKLRTQLAEVSRLLGINLPVYVLFTRGDRLTFFTEYFSKLNNEESTRILGATLPIVHVREGIYAEQETNRISGVFERLFRKFCNARTTYLVREQEPMQLAGMYEFPREFRKVKTALVRFLVELCRPSQITVGPFLRGFYFSGVRPILVNEVAPATPIASAGGGGMMGATGIFQSGARAGAGPAAQRIVGQRKVPQWLFLGHFFTDLLLEDTAAKGASSSSIRASVPRRILLLTAAALCIFYSIALVLSFGHNRRLANNVKQAAAGIAAADMSGGGAASLDSLKRLETLRQSLEQLTVYHRTHPPTGYRWGLYIGEDLYPEVYNLYFADFKRLLLQPTQDTMVASMRALPGAPGPTDDYQPPYKTLKGYLETTNHPEKATQDFLPPVLLDRWSGPRNVDPERMALAEKQFKFYTDELKVKSPYPPDNDAAAIGNARHYLLQFGSFQSVYQAMLADAAKTGPSINYNKKFPNEEVTDGYDVASPFTKPGYDFMKVALRDPGKYFEGEEWVLGPHSATDIDRTKLAAQLATQYYSDYVAQWRKYMQNGRVMNYAGPADAAKKLEATSGNQSPLLQLFWLASQNIPSDLPDVAKAFQPVFAVEPASSVDKYIAPPNQSYMGALANLQVSLSSLVSQTGNDAAKNTTLASAVAAHGTAKQVQQVFNPDPEAHMDGIVFKLLEDPITYVENLLRSLGPATLNANGRNFCAEYAAMFNKFPFNPGVKPEATVDDVNGIFKQPDGKLWKFYNDNLSKLLPKPDYSPVTVDAVTLTPQFVAFFKQAAAFGEGLYAGNTPEPHFGYKLTPVPSEGIEGATVTLDGQEISYSGSNVTPKQFTWQSTGPHGAKASYNRGGPNEWDSEEGLWAIFHFFYNADRADPTGSAYTLVWIMRTGKDQHAIKLESGKELTVRFQVDMGNFPMVFAKSFFARMACVANVAKQ